MTVPERLASAIADRYRTVRELGAGGMATVYLAEDLRHDRRVALKVLRPELAAVIGAERFLAEIRTTANLQHPHILPLHDSGEAGGHVFYVMPFVEGHSLRERLTREKQLPVEEATRIAREVAEALDYAHRQGIVHRDVKPENILLHEGRALVADFGIALAVSRADGGSRMTETGMSLGTPHYMAPEQALGEREITGRADVFALGCVLYECLTGEPPFTGPTAQAIVARVLTDEPRDLRTQRRTIPPHVAAAVRTALEKLPADRFRDAAAFGAALADPAYRRAEEATAAQGAFALTTAAAWDPRLWPRPARLAAGALSVTAALLGTGWLAAGAPAAFDDAPAPVIAFEVPDGPDAFDPIRISATGALAWSSAEGIRLRPPGALEARLVPGTASEYSQDFDLSPDGQWLVFRAGSSVRRMRLAGGAAQLVASNFPDTSDIEMMWGEDDHIYLTIELYSADRDAEDITHLLRVPAGGGPVDTLLTVKQARFEVGSLLPGHRTLLLGVVNLGRNAAPDGQRTVAFDLRSRDTVSVLPDALSPQWSPTGHVLAVREDGNLIALPFDPVRVRALGSPVSVLDSVTVPANLFRAQYRLGGGGTLAYMRGPSYRQLSEPGAVTYRMALVTPEGDLQELPLPPTSPPGGAISPDGRRLAYTRGDGVWLFDLATGSQRPLAGVGANPRNPVWSPDGRRIAFGADLPGEPPGRIYAVEADGDTAVVDLGARPGGEDGSWPEQWLADGTLLFATIERSGARDIHRLQTDGDPAAAPVLNADWSESDPRVSPDGRWIAYESNEISQGWSPGRIYVRRWPDLSQQTELPGTSGPRSAVWSPDGRTLYVALAGSELPPRLVAYQLAEREGGREVVSERVVITADTYIHATSTHPDGRLLAFISSRRPPSGTPSRLVVVSNWLEVLRERAGQ